MKILVIDNHTIHLKQLLGSLAGHEIEVQKYAPGLVFHEQGKDLVILSGGGGEGREAHNKTTRGELFYQDEINFIKRTKLPVVGICMGFELIAMAFGSRVKKLPEKVDGFEIIRLARDRAIKQFEAHHFGVNDVNETELEVLGRSKDGVELIKHKRRPIVASQFHPEVEGGDITLTRLVKTVVAH